MSRERRINWKDALTKSAGEKQERRQKLLEQKDSLSEQIHNLTIEQVRSSLYSDLKKQQAEIIATLAAL